VRSIANKILYATRDFSETQYAPVLEKALIEFRRNNFDATEKYLSQLPTEYELLENLIDRVKDKPVYANLKKILNAESVSIADQKIALSSLFTRCIIESKDNPEFRLIEKIILEKLARVGDVI